jgi:hypothetical protein
MAAAQTPRRLRLQFGATLSLMRRARRSIAITSLSISVLLLIVLSPLALKLVAKKRGIDWSQLSNVGQSYGAISAVLSALAVAGVSVSLIFQAREALSARRQGTRAIHTDLMRMAMDDPAYMECWGNIFGDRSHNERRQFLYVNLMIAFWATLWETGDFEERSLREIAANELFSAKPGRQFWESIEGKWYTHATNAHMNRFLKILDEAYIHAAGSGAPVTRQSPAKVERKIELKPRDVVGTATVMCAALVGGLIYRKALRRHNP